MTINTTSLGEKLTPYVQAMMGASGLDEEQAKTCVYYALATYRVEGCELFPILLLNGKIGTGKSSTLDQLSKMVCKPAYITGKTKPTVRDQLIGATTALIDEGDFIAGIEELLTYRYSKNNSNQTVNRANQWGGFQACDGNIFGATIICRRRPFRDVALRSRAIPIRTQRKNGKYNITDVLGLKEIADMIETKTIETSDRVRDTWKPILSIASSIDDTDWLGYADRQIQKEIRQLEINQGMEPSDALIHALEALDKYKNGEQDLHIKLSDLKRVLKDEFDVRQTIPQIADICEGLNLQVVNSHGYFNIKTNSEQIESLIRELES